jgi:hypothetical protein
MLALDDATRTPPTQDPQNVKICSGRFSAGFGAAACSLRLMIGGGGSTANRAACDVIGTTGGAAAAAIGADDPKAERGSTRGTIAVGLGSGGAGRGVSPAGNAGCSLTFKKSPTRLSTNWLIETLLASQKAFNRS